MSRPQPTNPRSYLLRLAALTAGVLTLVGAVNVSVDPYDALGRNRIGIFLSGERLAKPEMVQHYPHDALLLGSSKVDYVDPRALSGYHFFNAALSAALPEEMRSFLEHHLAGTRAVLLGLDLYMWNESAFPYQAGDPFAPEERLSFAGYVWSGDVLEASLRTVWRRLAGRPCHLRPSGQRCPEKDLRRHQALRQLQTRRVFRVLREENYRDFHFSTARIREMRRTKALLDAAGVRTVVFLNPLSRPVLGLIERLQLRGQLERLRRELRRVFPDLVDLSDSRWSDPSGFFRHDPYHYLPSTGAAFLNQLLEQTLARATADPEHLPGPRTRRRGQGAREREIP